MSYIFLLIKESLIMSKGYVLMVVLLITGSNVYSQVDEFIVKGVFIEKFSRFVNWPKSTEIENASNHFVIAVIGDNGFSVTLSKLYSTRKIKDKDVEVRTISDIHQIHGAHILFIGDIGDETLTEIMNEIAREPILTIGDKEGYAETGVMINFAKLEGKLQFEINKAAVDLAKLQMSYLLLKEAILTN